MSKIIPIVILLLSVLMITGSLFAEGASFTQDDKNRLIRIEEGLKATNQRIDAMNQKIEDGLKATNQRIDDLKDLSYVVIGGMFVLIGFVLWDRRTALAPAIRKNKELEEREDRIEKALKEYAKKEPELEYILKKMGLQ